MKKKTIGWKTYAILGTLAVAGMLIAAAITRGVMAGQIAVSLAVIPVLWAAAYLGKDF